MLKHSIRQERPMFLTRHQLIVLALCGCLAPIAFAETPSPTASGWTTHSPRDEIRPEFEYVPAKTPNDSERFVIRADEREGLVGSWQKTFEITGGRTYKFSVRQKTTGIEFPRRTAVVRILWLDEKGNKAVRDEPTFASYNPGQPPRAEPEFPPEQRTTPDGWTEVGDVYTVPKSVKQALVELNYRWEPTGQIEWENLSFEETKPLPPRKVRLATIHHRPREGKTPKDKREQFAPLIADAAKQNADLVVLPETLTFYGTGLEYVDCAESIPGPSTEYFGKLAKQHDLHIVAGLLERDKHLVYNVSVLIGPDGKIIGKYRKVTLPRGEIEGGITPGHEYPVFETRFGKVGMMICYDGFFPEVARELSNNGAEVIAWPVWGCNPMLGAARACENHVYVVSSTYTDVSSNWMVSAVFGLDGQILSQAKEWPSVSVQEVDLNKPLYWHSLGDFQAQIQRHRPVVPAEQKRDRQQEKNLADNLEE